MVDRRQVMRATAPLQAATPSATPSTHGRWMLNSGAPIVLTVEGLNEVDGEPQPVLAIVDLESARPMGETIITLRDHDLQKPVGSWSDIAIGADGILASLALAKPSNPGSLPDATEIADLLAAKVPMQASIGIEPGVTGRWEMQSPGVLITVNRRSYTTPQDMPCFVLRNGLLFEGSIVPFGADDHTGRLAAAKSNPLTSPSTKEHPVTIDPARMKALFAKYPKSFHGEIGVMLADGADDTAVAQAMHKAELAEKDVAIATLTADKCKLEADLAKAAAEANADDGDGDEAAAKKGKAAAAKAKADAIELAKTGSGTGVTFKGTEGASERAAAQPKSMLAFMCQLQETNPKLRGIALHNEALRLAKAKGLKLTRGISVSDPAAPKFAFAQTGSDD